MLSRPIGLALLAATCTTAAAGGAYLALRQNSQNDQVSVDASAPAEMEAALAVVEMTEAVVEELPGEVAAAEGSTAAPGPKSRSSVSEAADPTETRVTSPEPAVAARAPVRPAPPSAEPVERTRVADLPPVDGWVGLDEAWPTREAVLADEVPLTPVDVSAYGTVLEADAPSRILEELIVAADSVIGLQIETPVSSETAREEDEVEARVTRDVTVNDQIAVPAGTRMLGSVVLVERGGKVKEQARLGIRFHTIVLASSDQLPVVTETVYREGKSPGGKSTAKIGTAAVAGAILGGIFGGTRGAVISGSAGAAGGTATVLASDRNPATFPAGLTLTVRLSEPAAVTIEH